MWYWWLCLSFALVVPITMLIAGIIMQKRPPRSINSWFGYRTRRSMKTPDTWDFAHKYCGKLWRLIGLISLVPTVLAMLAVYHKNENIVAMVMLSIMAVQLILMALSIFITERALKRKFPAMLLC